MMNFLTLLNLLTQNFDELDLLRFDFASAYYGYKTINGSWPECKKGDYKALTRLVLALFKKCEEFNAAQNTSKETMKEESVKNTISSEPLYEVEKSTSGRPFTIPLSYEEVKLSLKKPTCKF